MAQFYQVTDSRDELIDHQRDFVIDEFTKSHLAAYCDFIVFADEREEFTAYALQAITDDPKLAEYGWPPIYRSFVSRKD